MAKMLKQAPGPAAKLGRPAAKALEGIARQEEKIDFILQLFAPFTLDQKGPFSCANTHAAYARLSPEDRADAPLVPGEDRLGRLLDEPAHAGHGEARPPVDGGEATRRSSRRSRRTRRSRRSSTRWPSATSTRVAFGRLEEDGIARTTFLDVQTRSNAVAARLAALGVKKGDRVVLSGAQPPRLADRVLRHRARRRAPPCRSIRRSIRPQFANVVRESEARVVLWDAKVEEACGAALARSSARRSITRHLDAITPATAQPAIADRSRVPSVDVLEDDVASLIYTSGTTGKPKGVMLTHANFTSLVAALAPLFPLTGGDRVLSVLPLHHTFEFTCGMVLPFSRGARVVYLDELKGDRVTAGLKQARVTAMVGVPARVAAPRAAHPLAGLRARARSPRRRSRSAPSSIACSARRTGIDLGRVLFGQVHEGLGGNIRYLISGGAALPKDTAKLFAGLGFKLTEGYGLTEAAPVLTVAQARLSPRGPGRQGDPGRHDQDRLARRARRRRGARARPQRDGRLHRRRGHQGREVARTAGSTPATSASSIAAGASSSSAA